MYDYYEEPPYYEPTLADEIMFEYQQKMKDALLESVKFQIENIKQENIDLKEENKTLLNKQHQVAIKERELLEKEKNIRKAILS